MTNNLSKTIKIFIFKPGQIIWQFPEIRHLICQLDANEGKDSKIACNLSKIRVIGLNMLASINLARRQIISQSTTLILTQ